MELELPNIKRDALAGSAQIAKAIEEAAGGFVEAAQASAEATHVSAGILYQSFRHTSGRSAEAVRELIGQTANDWADLLHDLVHGRGRAATRTARSLFEEAVTVLEVAGDSDIASRFIDHRPVAVVQHADLTRVESLLDGKELRSARHHLRKLRRTHQQDVDAAVEKYGASYRRSWSDRSLFDRAKDLGLEDDYAFYRVASQPVHASIGGLAGSAADISGRQVVRTGPALTPCIAAAVYGLEAARHIATTAEHATRLTDKLPWTQSLSVVEQELPAYMRAILEIDAELWPDEPPINMAPMVVVSSRRNATLWLAFPDARTATPYDGDYRTTEAQDRTYRTLVEKVLPQLDIDRLGIVFHDAEILHFRSAAIANREDLDRIVPSTPFVIEGDGTVRYPDDFVAIPYVDDILKGT